VDEQVLTLFLCGDVMTGRGVDQILPHPGDPRLREPVVRDAREYVALAERVNGPLPRPVEVTWPWGDALEILDDWAPDARLINLETSVTTSDDFAAGKVVHYRMHPANVSCLTAVRPDLCVLANNHMLDFGRRGLLQTLDVLAAAGLRHAGAGGSAPAARRPAVIPVPERRRIIVCAVGATSSGIPDSWAAGPEQPGLDVLADLSKADQVIDRVGQMKRGRDIAVVSVHWGSNWGYAVPAEQVRFAHSLVDGGVDVVHGHSSHHPRAFEVYRDRLILYGCGDLIDDYEGIRGHEAFRPDLRLLYFAQVDPDTGQLVALVLVPLQARRLRLQRANRCDARWLASTLTDAAEAFSSRLDLDSENRLVLRPRRPS
jgi:poly-gamma-glutamate capsule biosynthesis protein CapA/YwtB (metallophosphatase superfamily)